MGRIAQKKNQIMEDFKSDGDLFIPPDSNMKSFQAGVFNLSILNTMQSIGSELKRDETTLVLVSGKRAITKEGIFFVYKNQIITGSLYLVGEERVDETIRGGYLENYLSEVFCPSELVSRICLHDRYLRVRGRALCLGTWFF